MKQICKWDEHADIMQHPMIATSYQPISSSDVFEVGLPVCETSLPSVFQGEITCPCGSSVFIINPEHWALRQATKAFREMFTKACAQTWAEQQFEHTDAS